jgi:hypothetical protein
MSFGHFHSQLVLKIYCRGNFTGKITMQVSKQFFLIMILNIQKIFLVAMFINSTFLYYDLVLEDVILASFKIWITLYEYDLELTLTSLMQTVEHQHLLFQCVKRINKTNIWKLKNLTEKFLDFITLHPL